MTLRLRLSLLVIGIVVAGLVISDVVTYNALRSFLTTRVDQQLEGAAFPVGRALLSTSGLGPEVPAAPRTAPGFTGRRGGTVPSLPTGAFRNGGGFFGQSRSAARGVLVPPGTYGVLRSASGKVEAHLSFSYGGKAPTSPKIPVDLPGSGLSTGPDVYFTTSSSGSGAVSYRALAKPLAAHGGVLVVAVPLTDLDSTLRQLLLVELIVSAVLLSGLGLLSWIMVRRDLRPLAEITETAGAITRGDMSQRVSHVAEGTEVGQLGLAFNTMIDEIETAFAARAASEVRLRRFLADASHELRTPLTSILGYAELFDLGVRDRPADLARSLHHIRDEASRMGTLVDDLLLLAQLDHERPLRIGPVDLTDLVRRAVAGIRASYPDRRVAVDVAEGVAVDGDEHRLRQVVDNLLVNAVVHTPAGSDIDVWLVADQEWADLTVHDEGPGIAPADASRIFEPFFRSDPSRSRTSGGTGLGLAIVAAVVGAHHGQVAVKPGVGATFEVRLPTEQAGRTDDHVEDAVASGAPMNNAGPRDAGAANQTAGKDQPVGDDQQAGEDEPAGEDQRGGDRVPGA
jgi:two-component system, OmpR family, sensor kinase